MKGFLCPKCAQPLTGESGALRCASGHSYDLAKSGYVNLLLNAGGVHGDDKRMVRARRDFFARGYYDPLMQAVAEFCKENLPLGGTLLDCGCGEGSYTCAVLSALDGRDAKVLGVDISKDAVDLAAKKAKGAAFAVASVYHLPIGNETVDGILNLFAPMVEGEYARALKKGGWVLKATPLPAHLYELKKAIYDEAYLTEPEPENWEGFVLKEKRTVCFSMHLDTGEAIRSLFEMTPYCYTTPREGMERLAQLTTLDTQAQFVLAVYEKVGD